MGVAFSPDGIRVMAGDAGITAVKVWDLGPTGDAEWANLPAAGRPAAEFMPDGRHLVTTSPEGADFDAGRAVTIWDLQTGRDLRTIGPASDYFRFLAFDVRPDGGSIALGGQSMPNFFGGGSAVRAWDTPTGDELFRIGHYLDVNEVDFSPDGEYPATASYDGTAKILDRSGRVIQVLGKGPVPNFGQFVFSDVAFSFDGRLVATAENIYSRKQRVRIWDWLQGELAFTIDADSPVPQVDFDPTGPRVALTGSDGLTEVCLGGRAAERFVIGETSTGASNDLAAATQIATRMVREFGMSPRVGPVGFAEGGPQYLGPSQPTSRPYAEETQRVIDEEVARVLGDADARATSVLESHPDGLDKVVALLLERETIDGGDVEAALRTTMGQTPSPSVDAKPVEVVTVDGKRP